MQSLDYKLKTSNTSYVTARHDVQYFPSLLSSFSPTTSRVCRTPLTSGRPFLVFWAHSEAVPLNIKNDEEGHPRLFSRFLGALKSGVTKHQK